MANNYQRGRSFEYRCKEALEKAGYYVTRSASSAGVADLVAIGHGTTLLVQCKLNCSASMDELQDLWLVTKVFGGRTVLAILAYAPVNSHIQWYLVWPSGLYDLEDCPKFGLVFKEEAVEIA